MSKKFIRQISFIMVLFLLFSFAAEAQPYVAAQEAAGVVFDGWTAGAGYSLTCNIAYEGSYCLEHRGDESVSRISFVSVCIQRYPFRRDDVSLSVLQFAG